MEFEFNYYDINNDVIEAGIRGLLKSYLNNAVQMIKEANKWEDLSFVKTIMNDGYATIIQIAERREVNGLEKIKQDAKKINKFLENCD